MSSNSSDSSSLKSRKNVKVSPKLPDHSSEESTSSPIQDVSLEDLHQQPVSTPQESKTQPENSFTKTAPSQIAKPIPTYEEAEKPEIPPNQNPNKYRESLEQSVDSTSQESETHLENSLTKTAPSQIAKPIPTYEEAKNPEIPPNQNPNKYRESLEHSVVSTSQESKTHLENPMKTTARNQIARPVPTSEETEKSEIPPIQNPSKYRESLEQSVVSTSQESKTHLENPMKTTARNQIARPVPTSEETEKAEIPTIQNPKKYRENIAFLQEHLFGTHPGVNEELLKETQILLFGDLIDYPPPPPPCNCKKLWEDEEKRRLKIGDCGLQGCACESCGCDVKSKPPQIVNREDLKKYQAKRDSKIPNNQEVVVGNVEVDFAPFSPLLSTTEQVVSVDENNNNIIDDYMGYYKKKTEQIDKTTYQQPTDIPFPGIFVTKNETRIETTCFMANLQTNSKSPVGTERAGGALGHTRTRRSDHKGSSKCRVKQAQSCCCCDESSSDSSSGDDDGCCEFPSQFLWFMLTMNSTANYYKSQVAYQHHIQQQCRDQPAMDECFEDEEPQVGNNVNNNSQSREGSNVTKIDISNLEEIIKRQGKDTLTNKDVAINLRAFNPDTAKFIPDNPLIDMKSLKLFAHGEKEQAECSCTSKCQGETGRECCGVSKGEKIGNGSCPPPCCAPGCGGATMPSSPQCTFPISSAPCQMPCTSAPSPHTASYCYPQQCHPPPCYPCSPILPSMCYPPSPCYPCPPTFPPMYYPSFPVPYCGLQTPYCGVPCMPSCYPTGYGGCDGLDEEESCDDDDRYFEGQGQDAADGSGSGGRRRSSSRSGSSQRRNSAFARGGPNSGARYGTRGQGGHDNYAGKGNVRRSYGSGRDSGSMRGSNAANGRKQNNMLGTSVTNINLKYVRGPGQK